MTTSRERCAVCDFPLATDADDAVLDKAVSAGVPLDDATLFSDVLCWSRYAGEHREGGELANGLRHWRARALEASSAMDALEDKYAALRHSNDAAEARVEALEGALRAADYRLGEVSNYLGPFDHALMFRALSETIAQVRAALSATPPKPAPRPDAAEALRVAMAAMEGLIEQCHALSHAVQPAVGVARLRLASPFTEEFGDKACAALDAWAPAVRGGAAALELLRAHVEPTPLETAVLTHTEELEAKAAPTPVVVTREVVEALSEFARTWARFGADCEPENAAARLVVAVGGALEAKP